MNRYYRLFPLTLLIVIALMAAGCMPVNMAAMSEAMANTSMADENADESTEDSESMTESSDMEMMDDDSAMATVTTRSLRVREAAGEEAEVVFGVNEGETYKVMSISDDGQWVQLAIEDAPDGQGWVSANYVSVNGALTGGEGEMATESDTESGTESTDIILQPTAVPAEEASEPQPTAVPAEESSELQPTPVPAEESSEAMDGDAMAEEEIVAPAAGFALVNTDGTRLRVRAEANAESEIAGYVYDGETYAVVEISDDGAWVKIAGDSAEVTDNPDGGWVAAEFLVMGE